MPQRDPRIDAYIAHAAPFARPVLAYFRDAVHAACPQVEETMKWSAPAFLHGGRILAGMAAFKQHASFGFWQHARVMGEGEPRTGMGSYGRITSLDQVPTRARLRADIRKAMRIGEEGPAARGPRKAATPRPPAEVPPDLAAALARNARAQATFDAFPPGQRREYVDWISEAKRDATRASRLAQAVEWMAQGKRRNWKYERC